MLTLIALSAVLMQEPPAPPAPPEVHTRFMIMGDGPGALDKDGDGQVSREEFAAPMNEHFARMDTNGDGRLSTEEMAAGHDGPGDHEMTILRGPGGDGGPGMGHFEMRRSHPAGEAGMHQEHSEERTMVFVGGDQGADGEREIVIHGGPGHDGPRVIHLPGAGHDAEDVNVQVRRFGGPGDEHDMDADHDGRISEAEFTGPLREAFARMDADHSGFIEEGERGQGHDVQVFTHRIETRQNGED